METVWKHINIWWSPLFYFRNYKITSTTPQPRPDIGPAQTLLPHVPHLAKQLPPNPLKPTLIPLKHQQPHIRSKCDS